MLGDFTNLLPRDDFRGNRLSLLVEVSNGDFILRNHLHFFGEHRETRFMCQQP